MCRLDTATSDMSSSPSRVAAARIAASFSLGARIASTSASMPPARTTLPTRCSVMTSTRSNTTVLNQPLLLLNCPEPGRLPAAASLAAWPYRAPAQTQSPAA
ncbi:hypothetical protein BX661DRAFT_178252 [Kickxella alabastrina]|uniref:uncharacterized protein n=1 Tax=Kickxella alabastrina TaxID=61397 RepID=UPI00222081CC|nr:uncharacterized protein BX661DRAFT_178252 [Kickxella alabastrina]KAI7833363.1 hypothetical protein BX661DRAFT_178252 [Kickxella alabastrina]